MNKPLRRPLPFLIVHTLPGPSCWPAVPSEPSQVASAVAAWGICVRGGQGRLHGSAPSQVICQVSLAQVSDVDKAVAAAKDAFENGLWGKISARDRGRLLYR